MATETTQRYDHVVARHVMIPMRDGVRLAADIYRPAIDGEIVPGAFPVLLGRTSYDKSNTWLWVEPVCEWFVARGFVVVVQDQRGRYLSEGTGDYFHTVNPKEGIDGYDTIEWIAQQPWCNGRVGMTGSSHGAIVQQVAALHRPPHLAAIWPDVGPTNIYEHEAREGGAMSMQMFGAIFMHAFEAQEAYATPGARDAIIADMQRMADLSQETPFREGQTALRHVPGLEQTMLNYYRRGRYDEWWHQEAANQEPYWDRHADIPGVYTGGWWDPFSKGTTRYFARMAEQNTTPQRLVIGPWSHDGMRTGFTYTNDVDFGEAGVWGYERYNEERLRWFGRWLRDDDTGVDDDPAVRIFVMGGGDGHKTAEGHLYHGGRWREEPEWPIARTRHVPYYLHADGSLSPERPAEGAAPRRYTFDPDRPVPSMGGCATAFFEMVRVLDGVEPWFESYIPWRVRMRNILPTGPCNQVDADGRFLSERDDVLVFQTEPLREAVELTGSVTVHLWIASSAPDTDFTAKLVDVHPPNADYPDGYHLNLPDSIIRTRFRNGWDREELMEPGEVCEVAIELPPTSNLFAVGHRIRIDISSSNAPRLDVNPNTGEPIGHHTRTEVAQQSVFVDAARPSHAVLPLIPAGEG
jgi:putative CocE/NonD family hydrolase